MNSYFIRQFKNNIQLLACFLFLVFSGCSKDKTTTCANFEDLPLTYPKVAPTDRRYVYITPHFNPNNSNEFACIQSDGINHFASIVIYNLQTGVLKNINTPNGVSSGPRWSKKDWFVYDLHGNIYKMKSNGDSLIQLTSTGINFFPFWNFDGTKITYETNRAISGGEIIDENGILIYSQYMSHLGGDWSLPNNLIVSSTTKEIVLINDTNFTSKNISFTNNVGYFGVCWIDNDNLLVIADNSIYKLNINTETKTLIKEGCQTKSYGSVSISNDRQKIIADALEYTVNPANNTIENHNEIYLMNIDGSNETKIQLPKN